MNQFGFIATILIILFDHLKMESRIIELCGFDLGVYELLKGYLVMSIKIWKLPEMLQVGLVEVDNKFMIFLKAI